MRSLLLQLRGALIFYGIILVGLTVLNVWMMKDRRHLAIVIADDNCNTMLVDEATKESVKAFFEVEGGR